MGRNVQLPPLSKGEEGAYIFFMKQVPVEVTACQKHVTDFPFACHLKNK